MSTSEAKESDWWVDFFHGPFGDMQVTGLLEERAAEEVDFIERVMELASGARVLDVPCGPGRHSLELAARGHDVTGVDFNERVLDRARAHAAARGVRVIFEKRDMRALAFGPVFDAVICYWGSFGYFDEAGDRAFAEGAFRSLAPDGRLLVETHVVETLVPIFTRRGWDWWGEGKAAVRVLQERTWNLETGRVEGTWTFVDNGSAVSRPTSIRLYTYRELCGLLRSVGFRAFTGFDTTTGKPFTVGAKRLTLVAQK